MKKKKIIIIVLTIIIAIVLTILISVYIFIRSRLTIKAVIVECNENAIFVYDLNRREYKNIYLPKNINLKFKLGQEVRIHLSYDACKEGSYDGRINSEFIKKIKIIKENGNTQIVEDYNTLKQKVLLERNKINTYML